MAKSRAQRKAERRKREAQGIADPAQARDADSRAQHDTQVPESPDVVEAELAEQGADIDALREQGESKPEEAPPAAPPAPAPSRADVGQPAPAEADDKISRKAAKRAEREQRQRRKESEQRRRPKEEPVERQRGRVMAFFASCVAELKRVQWPDRETLIQASAVTLIFIAVAAAYLGVLDGIFSELVKIVL
jgi:preprotein translocase SecE subunit